MKILRTPDSQFENLPGYAFEPHYANITDSDGTELRVHYIDEGPDDADPILLMHGNPSWSYIYRKMIPGLLETGRRVIAVDLIGCGRSDKPARRKDYTLARHVEWMEKFVLALDLENITLFCQDWGGVIGLNVVALHPARYDRIIMSNTGIPVGDGGNNFLRNWLRLMKVMPSFPWKSVFRKQIKNPNFSEGEFDAYRKAPFPKRAFQAGIMQFPQLIAVFPDNPGVPQNKFAWGELKKFDKPVLTLYGNRDPITRGYEKAVIKKVLGAQNQPHKIIEGGGHFIQEDKPEELLAEIIPFLNAS